MISILFVALFHWNVDRDSSPRHKAIPVLFQVFPLFPLVLCGRVGSKCLRVGEAGMRVPPAGNRKHMLVHQQLLC